MQHVLHITLTTKNSKENGELYLLIYYKIPIAQRDDSIESTLMQCLVVWS